MQGTMEWNDVRSLYEACLGKRISETRAAELLGELVDKTTLYNAIGPRMEVLNIVTSDPIGPADDPRSPYFNRCQPVEKVESFVMPKTVEWKDEAGEIVSLSRVGTICYEAFSESYTASGNRRVQDCIRSGPENFIKAEDGTVLQYGAATSLLTRLLEAAAHKPLDPEPTSVLVPMEMMSAAGSAIPEFEPAIPRNLAPAVEEEE